MKIAYVYDAVYPWEKGGAQKRVWEIARRLAETHDVHLYGMHYWNGPDTIERDGVTFHGVCDPKDLYVNGRRSIRQALHFAVHVAPRLRDAQFDIVDCQAWPLFPLFPLKLHEIARELRLCATWFEVWDQYWYDYLGYKGVFGRAIERASVRLPTEIITLSDHLKADLATIGRETNVSVVHNGVDYEGLQNVPVAEHDWDVIYVGRLAEHKHVDVLLDAVAQVTDQLDRDVSCGIIGDGPERTALEAYARDRGVTEAVEFLGFVEEDETVVANLKAADVFVLPSTREGFPNTILEANACGTPSIVVDHPDNGGTAVVNDGETGYITPLSSEVMADRITTVLTDRATRRRLQTNARTFGKQHDWDRIVDELEQVYTDLVTNTREVEVSHPHAT
ncbi:glycosyltransferase family 4 protein [Halorussus salinisoli]|uniref:glycosyltransferase family 4 protein n=1 Tax=Halorussus salinisoli TaxID=2558242 RepID=UPI0014851F3A|nr:glycosyltransferase family 4 protein [Halorussus salinisoli]